MAGPVLGKIFKDSPCQITPLYFEPDGSFPGHEPNPMDDENREDLKAKVLGTKADFGFIFDGDADRFIMIDQGGEFIPPDYIVAILAEDILKKNPGAKVVSDATVSWAIKDTVLKHRGELIVWKTGHSLITQKMKETGAIFAGETSGHFYFREFYDFDTGILPALLLLQIISQKKEPFARIIEDFKRKYFLTGIINFKIEDKEGVMRKVEEIYKAKEAKISHIDGVSIEFLDWRFILRPSNTEPLLRLILEARSADLRDQKREEVSKLVQEG
jgi:phosphomannomutase